MTCGIPCHTHINIKPLIDDVVPCIPYRHGTPYVIIIDMAFVKCHANVSLNDSPTFSNGRDLIGLNFAI